MKRGKRETYSFWQDAFWFSVAVWSIVIFYILFSHQAKLLNKEVANKMEAEKVTSVEVEVEDNRIPGDDIPASGYASLEAFLADGNKLYNEASFTMTHYCGCKECCGSWSDGEELDATGAAGSKLTPYYSIAVDTSIIPLGTILHDANGNEYKAEDTGSAIKGYKVDLFTGNHEEANELGVKQSLILYWEE